MDVKLPYIVNKTCLCIIFTLSVNVLPLATSRYVVTVALVSLQRPQVCTSSMFFTDCKMAASSIVFLQSFVKIDHVVQKLKQRQGESNYIVYFVILNGVTSTTVEFSSKTEYKILESHT
jgi:hypothetical protein